MDLNKEKVQGKEVLHVSGRLDALNSPILEKHLLGEIANGEKKLLLDFLNVDYLSSSGLRVLLATQKKLDAIDGQLVLFAVDDMVMDVIKMSGLDRIFKIVSSQQKALEL